MDQSPVFTDPVPVAEEHPVPGCVQALAGGICTPQGLETPPNAAATEPSASANGSGGGGGWWRGLVSTARNQSSNVMNFMRRDLGEFVSVVRDDTKDVVQKTAGAVRESVNSDTASAATSRLKSGLTRFLDTVTTAMTIPPDDSDEQPLVFREGAWHVAKNRQEARILTLQADKATYESLPEDPQFQKWREDFDVEAKKGEISELLVSCADVRTNYTLLVPKTLLHREFWARYFFRLECLEKEEARWEALKERAGRQDAVSSDWGDDWDEESPALAAVPVVPAVPAAEKAEEREEPKAEPQSAVPEPEGQDCAAEAVGAVDSAPSVVKMEEEEKEMEKEEEGEAEMDAAGDSSLDPKFRVSERADAVVVKHKDSPESSSESCASAGPAEECPPEQDGKDLEEWEADLEADVTAEEIEEAKRTARQMKEDNELDDEEDWENWE